MRKALDEAQQAFDEGEIPIGAVVVCQDRIIARAHNLTETLHDVTAHAEMQAITAAANALGGKYLTDCTPEPWAGARYLALSMAVATRSVAIPTMPHTLCIPNVLSQVVYSKTSVAN